MCDFDVFEGGESMRMNKVSLCVLAALAGSMASAANADVTKIVDNNGAAGDVAALFVEATFPISSENGQSATSGTRVDMVSSTSVAWNMGTFNRGGRLGNSQSGTDIESGSNGQIGGNDTGIQSVPLPTASLMAGIGLFGMGIRRRRA